MPICTKCKLDKDLIHFSKKSSTKTGYNYTCKSCIAIVQNKWYHKNHQYNKQQSRQNAWKSWGLTTTYGEYLDICQQQDHSCAICGSKEHLFLDHCHDTRHVRGALCPSCNSGLGYFKDNPQTLLSAIEYLARAKRRVSAGLLVQA